MTEIKQLSRVTGIAGLATLVLIFVPLVAISGKEPDFTGSAAEVVTFMQSLDTPLAEFGRFVFTVGMLAFVWFVMALTTVLRAVEGPLAWRSAIAAASGVIAVALILTGHVDAAALRANDIEPQVARFAFDVGNVSFANAWVALGSFAVGSGLVLLRGDLFPHWLGWWAIGSGVGLILSRGVWLSGIWYLPYFLFWIWMIVVCVLLLRGRVPDQEPSELAGRSS